MLFSKNEKSDEKTSLLCFCRHFERNVTKWSEVEKSPTIVKMNFLREISPFRFASVEMTSRELTISSVLPRGCRTANPRTSGLS